VVYEARGSVPDDVLAGGVERVRGFGERSLARVVMLTADPSRRQRWVTAALAAVDDVVGGPASASDPP
jgi:hypothetical protein